MAEVLYMTEPNETNRQTLVSNGFSNENSIPENPPVMQPRIVPSLAIRNPLLAQMLIIQRPPQPVLTFTDTLGVFVLHWDLNLINYPARMHFYYLFTCTNIRYPPRLNDWQILGEIPAARLPVHCNITNYLTYDDIHYFAVLGVDEHFRAGPLSNFVNVMIMTVGDTTYIII
uniref:Activating transcription factor 7-interacting protein Fn3 domain-containing protein n=1 Tax=Strigamia maritima TaxID=126957 RepID=T1JJK4_STRMM